MVQQLTNEISHLKDEVRRLRGRLDRISIGNTIITGGSSNPSIPSPVVGAIIFGNTGPIWARRLIGNEGDVLTVESGVPVWTAPVGGGQFYIPFGSGEENFSP